MKLLAMLVLGAMTVGAPKAWTRLDRLYPSVAKLHILKGDEERGHCTAFMVNAREHYVMSAAHCTDGDAWALEIASHDVQGANVMVPAVLVQSNLAYDLAVWRVEKWHAPALRLRTAPIRLGMPLAAMGYGMGALAPIVTYGWVSHPNLPLPVGDFPPGVVVFGNYIAGMSGGPIVDEDNRVVSVVQAGGLPFTEAQDLGYGVLPELLRTFAARYWE